MRSTTLDSVKMAKNGMKVSIPLAVISTKSAAVRAVSMAKLAKKNASNFLISNIIKYYIIMFLFNFCLKHLKGIYSECIIQQEYSMMFVSFIITRFFISVTGYLNRTN